MPASLPVLQCLTRPACAAPRMLYKPQALPAALAACTHPATGPVPIHCLLASSALLPYYCATLTNFDSYCLYIDSMWCGLRPSAYLHDPLFKFKATLTVRAVLTSEHTCEG